MLDFLGRRRSGPSRARVESNRWLRSQAAGVTGRVLSIGSRDDRDGEGSHYRDHFENAAEYVTSDLDPGPGVDLVLDVRNMHKVRDGSFDCGFCSGVLEHVDDPWASVREIHRILVPRGALPPGVPVRRPLHMKPHDYWRFTAYGIQVLLRERFQILSLQAIDERDARFPAAYWVKAQRIP